MVLKVMVRSYSILQYYIFARNHSLCSDNLISNMQFMIEIQIYINREFK